MKDFQKSIERIGDSLGIHPPDLVASMLMNPAIKEISNIKVGDLRREIQKQLKSMGGGSSSNGIRGWQRPAELMRGGPGSTIYGGMPKDMMGRVIDVEPMGLVGGRYGTGRVRPGQPTDTMGRTLGYGQSGKGFFSVFEDLGRGFVTGFTLGAVDLTRGKTGGLAENLPFGSRGIATKVGIKPSDILELAGHEKSAAVAKKLGKGHSEMCGCGTKDFIAAAGHALGQLLHTTGIDDMTLSDVLSKAHSLVGKGSGKRCDCMGGTGFFDVFEDIGKGFLAGATLGAVDLTDGRLGVMDKILPFASSGVATKLGVKPSDVAALSGNVAAAGALKVVGKGVIGDISKKVTNFLSKINSSSAARAAIGAATTGAAGYAAYRGYNSSRGDTNPDQDTSPGMAVRPDPCVTTLASEGIGSSRDFRKWAVRGNHPDKGGDSERFAVVSDCKDKLIGKGSAGSMPGNWTVANTGNYLTSRGSISR